MHDGSGEDRAVTEQPGVVFAVDDDRAMYVTLADLDAYRNLAEAFGQVPTVAGPPLDLAVLERLRDALAAAKSDVQPAQGHRLSPAEAEYLGLLQLQGTLRATLPLRLHRTCVACGTKKIINPARPKASGTEKASNVASVISGLATLADDPVSGFVDIMKGMGGAQTTTALCDYCEGFEFELPAVTFCPACKALRTEAVLITCPDCRADFAAAEPARDWVPLARARDSARQADIRQLVAAACGRLSGGVYTEQQGSPPPTSRGACSGRAGRGTRRAARSCSPRPGSWSSPGRRWRVRRLWTVCCGRRSQLSTTSDPAARTRRSNSTAATRPRCSSPGSARSARTWTARERWTWWRSPAPRRRSLA